MIQSLVARLRQGYRTFAYPYGDPPPLSDRFHGRPVIRASSCDRCLQCQAVCPTQALAFQEIHSANDSQERSSIPNRDPAIDLGRCLFCGACAKTCPRHAIHVEKDHRLSVDRREDLWSEEGRPYRLAQGLSEEFRRLIGRSLKLRQVSAGGCNACEADVNVLTTIGWDLGRFGIQIVASPRHADGILVTGPVTENMRLALLKTYEAVPEPRVVIAVGACAISGGIFADHPEQHGGVATLLPVDLFVPGCPPHPLTILDGLLRLLHKIRE